MPHGRQSRLITPPAKKNRAFPTGNALLYISLLSVAFGRVRPIQGRTLFFVLPLIFEPMTPSHFLQIFLWVAIQNQIGIAKRVIVDEIIQF